MEECWTEIMIEVPVSEAETAGNIANMVVPYGIYIEDYSNLEGETLEIAHIDLIDDSLLAKDRTKAWIHVYISPAENPREALSYLEQRLNELEIPYDIRISDCQDTDWLNNWKKYFKPIPVGEKLLIRPIWEDPVSPGDRIVLDLEPGLAFGTGTHETTRLCMELMEQYLKPGQRFLDMGCGSGILSVAALLLGAKAAVGVDIDALAVKTARENAAINGVSDRFTGICGNLTEKIRDRYDVIAANIVADIVIQLTKDAPGFLNPDGVYMVSGIIDQREEEVLAALAPSFRILARREERGWVALACGLRPADPKIPPPVAAG